MDQWQDAFKTLYAQQYISGIPEKGFDYKQFLEEGREDKFDIKTVV